MEKNIQDDLQNNPNNVISNITWKTLSDTEIEILKYRLKYGFVIRLSEVEMIVIAQIKLNTKDYVTISWDGEELKLHWELLLTFI